MPITTVKWPYQCIANSLNLKWPPLTSKRPQWRPFLAIPMSMTCQKGMIIWPFTKLWIAAKRTMQLIQEGQFTRTKVIQWRTWKLQLPASSLLTSRRVKLSSKQKIGTTRGWCRPGTSSKKINLLLEIVVPLEELLNWWCSLKVSSVPTVSVPRNHFERTRCSWAWDDLHMPCALARSGRFLAVDKEN